MSYAMQFFVCGSVGAVLAAIAIVGRDMLDPPKRPFHSVLILISFLLWLVFSTITYVCLSDANWQLRVGPVLASLGTGLVFVLVGLVWAVSLRELTAGRKLSLAAFRKFDFYFFVFLWVMFSGGVYHNFL